MLFGYLVDPNSAGADDVISLEADLDSLSFDRPLRLETELEVSGAMAFALSYGFGGFSLVEWALRQTVESAAARDDAVILEGELFDAVVDEMLATPEAEATH